MSIRATTRGDACQGSEVVASLLADIRSGGARWALSRLLAQAFEPLLPEHLSKSAYTRTELVASDDLLVVLIAWLPGQFSEPHDHGGSSCLLRVLRGVATERRFEPQGDGPVSILEEDRYLPGAVIACEGNDIHALGNEADHVDVLITLHLYRPQPVMREYRVASGAKR